MGPIYGHVHRQFPISKDRTIHTKFHAIKQYHQYYLPNTHNITKNNTYLPSLQHKWSRLPTPSHITTTNITKTTTHSSLHIPRNITPLEPTTPPIHPSPSITSIS